MKLTLFGRMDERVLMWYAIDLRSCTSDYNRTPWVSATEDLALAAISRAPLAVISHRRERFES